ncbi:MAG: heme o synthase [Candidatus Latescibacteria bacterium]|nr:heme o synthase [Candidatus Latescibacterota bacterium]
MKATWNDYWTLTKPRIAFLVLVTAALGFFLGGKGIHAPWLFFCALVGTALSSCGAAVLNQYIERDVDGLMQRTRNRPLPTGRVKPMAALSFGFVLVLSGVFFLLFTVGLLTAFLALLSAFLYVVVYTPMKRQNWLNTTFGAIPGALPPVGGWTAATGTVDPGAIVLFLILFAWQHPHFYAIAWIFRDDYRRGGFKMLPVVEPDGDSTCWQVMGYSVLLLIFSVLPTFMGLTGSVYLVGVTVVGLLFLAAGVALSISRTVASARLLLKASVLYLPIMLVLSVLDPGF